MTKIYQWSDFESDFDDGIILGNGASLAVSATFSYSSLFNWASKKKLFTPNVQKVFKHLKTKDFELVLRILWHDSHVNQALRVQEKVTENAYKKVREALVKAIRDTHVEYEVSKPFLSPNWRILEEVFNRCIPELRSHRLLGNTREQQ